MQVHLKACAMGQNFDIYTIQNESVCDAIERLGYYRPDPADCLDAMDMNHYSMRLCYRWMIDRLVEKCGMPLGVSRDEFNALRAQDDRHFHDGWTRVDNEDGFVSFSMAPSPLPHPVWGWQKCYRRNDGKHDMRSWTTNEPEKVVRLRLSIPEERLLFSDFSYWHIPLNMGYFPSAEKWGDWEKEDEAFDRRCEEVGLRFGCDLFSNKITHLYAPEEDERISALQSELLDSWRECLLTPEQLGSADDPIPYRDCEWDDRETQCVFWEIRAEDVVKVERFTTRKAARG